MHVEGIWESSGLFYQRIEIDKNGKGYFAAGLDEDLEIYIIQEVIFSGKNVTLNLLSEESDSKTIQAKGYVTATSIVIEKFIEDGEIEKFDKPFFYLRESLVESTKNAIKSKVKTISK